MPDEAKSREPSPLANGRPLPQLVVVALAVLHVTSMLSPVAAQSWRRPGDGVETKLLASDGMPDDAFGYSTAVHGDTALIGARGDGSELPGSAYVFVREGGAWIEQAKLTPGEPSAGGFFGYSVAIYGDTALVGASGEGCCVGDWGAAYVFVRSGEVWTQQARLVPSGPASYAFFGESVALWEDTALVGSPWSNENGGAAGAAYVFVRDGDEWIEQAKLLPQDGQAGDEFGEAVSLWKDIAVLGADGDDDAATDAGAAYVFQRDGDEWIEEAKLVAPDGKLSLRFGESVAVLAGTIVAGATGDNTNGFESGSAYVFGDSGGAWQAEAKLLPTQKVTGAEFGTSISISAGSILVGAPFGHGVEFTAGSAHRFVEGGGGWMEVEKLVASDGQGLDRFGIAVAQSGATRLVGAFEDDDNGDGSGSAYVFDADPLELSVTGACPGQVTVTLSGAPPNSEVGMVAAANTKGFVKGGKLCTGVAVEIGEPFQLPPVWIKVDGSGSGTGGMVLEENRCWLEAVALANCQTSDAVLVP